MCSMNAPRKKAQDSEQINAQGQRKTGFKQADDSCACDVEASAMQSRAHRKSQPDQENSTKIVVKCNCGFPNKLYLRGEGIQGLSWDKGTLMKCTKADEWIWETDKPFNHAQIKVVLNDKQYEVGENHALDCGKSITFSPRF